MQIVSRLLIITYIAALVAEQASAQMSSIPVGTRIDARLETPVKTSTSEIGDNVIAVLTKNVHMADKVLVPKGSRLAGRVETVQAGTRASGGRVRLVFREIQLPDGRRLSTWITNSFGAPPPRRNIRYAVAMGIGAVAGGFIGGTRGRAAGVIGGLLTGFIVAGAKAPSVHDLTLKAGQDIRLQLGEDLTVTQN